MMNDTVIYDVENMIQNVMGISFPTRVSSDRHLEVVTADVCARLFDALCNI